MIRKKEEQIRQLVSKLEKTQISLQKEKEKNKKWREEIDQLTKNLTLAIKA